MQLSDNKERKEAIDLLKMRAEALETAAATVKASADALITGDAVGQFADATAMDAAVVAVRDEYYTLAIPGLGDVSDLYDITLPA